MKVIVDENMSRKVVDLLRQAGHDVEWAKQTMLGALDHEILAHAQATGRVVLTLDRDFGDLTFNKKLPARGGVIYIRDIEDKLSKNPYLIFELLISDEPWEGNFTTLIPGESPRVRPIPWD